MANEITLTINNALKNGALADSYNPGRIQITQAVQLLFADVVSLVAATDTVITFGHIVTAGLVHLINLDPTNYVEWGPESAGALVPVGKLMPADAPAIFRFDPGATLRMKAHTGACDVLVMCWNN
ncbi:MAG TPA: hypothetical protein VGH74_07560 [Planctomycetaceae bacterium]|jgi:hypothetical protein